MSYRYHLKLVGVIAGIAILSMGILTSSSRPTWDLAQRTTPYIFTFSNPSAVYCTDLGYDYQSVEDDSGGIHGVCIFSDNSQCDAWDFLAGKCGQQYSYCEQQGYDIRVEKNGIEGFAQEMAICTDGDGQDIGPVDELTQLKAKVYSCGKPDEANAGNGTTLVPEMDPLIQQIASSQLDNATPTEWDWRNATYKSVTGNWTTPVKDQGGCGSCWAFSAVGVSETALNLAAQNPALDPDLSEEYLVSDCHMADGYQTCCGGWDYDALEFIRDEGIPDEGCMPYVDGLDTGCGCNYGCNTSGTNACTYHGIGQCSDRTCANRCTNWASRITKINHTGYVGTDRTTIKNTLVAFGPLSVSIRASNWYWDGDVLRCSVDSPTNHAVAVVGYKDTPSVGAGGYWIVKNSWGSTWNGDGYVKIGYGECSIESDVYYASALTLTELTPTPLSPSGTIDGVASPTFKWTSSLGATSYRLAVYSYAESAYLILGTIENSYCNATECSYPSPINLTNGDYKFKVLAYTPGGVTPYSDWMNFAITGIPENPVPISPSGTLNGVMKPTFEWSTYPSATSYRLAVYSIPDASYLILDTVPTSYCSATQCTYPSPVTFSNGDYRFKVLAYIPGGVTPYSDWMLFDITGVTLPPPPYPPSPIGPTGFVTTHRPTFQWSSVEYATFYRLGVYSYATASYIILENLYPNCVAGVCSYTHPTVDLPNGNYQFKVMARNSSGYTAYSSWMSFSVFSYLPIAPTLLSPSGTVSINPPEFQWSAVSGATMYRLAVYSYNTGSYVILTYVYPSACSGSLCAYTPPSALASGNYKFKMLTYNAYGISGYSDWMSFTVP